MKMFDVKAAINDPVRRPDAGYRRQIFVLVCYAYIILGACSIVGGVLLYSMPFFLNHRHALHIDIGTGFLILVLVGFGFVRIGTALYNLRRMNRARHN